MNALSVYSGGCDGISLAASWVGIRTLAYCDNDPACRAVLRARHPEAPIFDTDEDVTTDGLCAHGIDPGTIDIVFGGPPCQIASIAGKRLGAVDPRNRWPQFLGIVGDIKPRWIMAENVPGLLSARGEDGIKGGLFGGILSTLAQMGYRVGWCCYGAGDVGAPHKRERLFIVGYAQHTRQSAAEITAGADVRDDRGEAGQDKPRESAGSSEQRAPMADAQGAGLSEWRRPTRGQAEHAQGLERFGAALEHAHSQRREEHDAPAFGTRSGFDPRRLAEGGRQGAAQSRMDGGFTGVSSGLDAAARRLEAQCWPAGRGQAQFEWEPPRIAAGVPNRAARIRMIGNSCPPQQYLVVLAAIAEADRMMKEAMHHEMPTLW